MIKIAKTPGTRVRARQGTARNWQGRALRSAAALLALATLAAPASARPFQQYLNGVCSGTLCTINFAKVPAGQRLVVNNVSCYMRLKQAPGFFNAEILAAQMLVLGANPANILNAVTLVPQIVGRTQTETVFSANHTISAFAGANARFQAYLELDRGSFSQFACHISGDLAKPT